MEKNLQNPKNLKINSNLQTYQKIQKFFEYAWAFAGQGLVLPQNGLFLSFATRR